MLTLNDGRIELWQWDTGRKLTVDADCSQVHFSNKVFGRSIDVDVVDGVAEIPDILLQTDKELNIWAFVGTSENGYTKISKKFKVNRRNKPADYVFTPPDQTTLEEIKEKIEHLESIQDPDAIKNAVEDYLENNPVEAPVQSVNGKTGKVDLTAEDVGAISQDNLQEATNKALAQAKESGEFDGDDGYTPQKGIDYFDGKDGYTPVKGVDYFDGQPGYTPQKGVDYFDGDDYVLTPDDKTEIAELAAELVEVPEVSGGGYVVQDTAPEDTSVLWVDPTDNTEDEVPGSVGNVDLGVTGATVGQTVKISAVDENGAPTAWMPTDFPSGGGGSEKMRFITKVITEEDLKSFEISEDSEGKPFSLNRIAMRVKMQGANNESARVFFVTNRGNFAEGSVGISATTKQDIHMSAEVMADGSLITMQGTPLVGASSVILYVPSSKSDNGTGQLITSAGFTTYQAVLAGAEITVWGC